MSDPTIPTLPEIVTSLPPRPRPGEEIVIPDDEIEEESPPEIVTSLPTLEHRIADTNFTPDGKIVRCVCGFSTHLCHSDEQAEIEWLEHL